MLSLMSIRDYVEQTANIIGGVLGLDIMIVDRELNILGDSDLEEITEDECLKEDSILAKVMDDQEWIILKSRFENPGCNTCRKKDRCMVEMIIGLPIFYEQSVVGALGVIASNEEDKDKMLENQDNYLKFIGRMLELIVNKMKQEEEIEEITLLKKRMEVALDSVDNAILLASEDGSVLQANSRFSMIFGKTAPESLEAFLEPLLMQQALSGDTEMKYREVTIGNSDKFLLSSKPVVIGDREHGALIQLRSLRDFANEIVEFSTYNMNVAFDDMIGESEQILEVKERISQIARSNSTVLIDGETGTGKEVVARLIHNVGERCDKPFVAINCSAIPEELMESELFGYEEGAFSGARKGGKIGKFQLADGGTIFLDEVGEMALHMQAKLLRVLQEKVVTKVGGLESVPVDVRIIAATNKNLDKLIRVGEFREDLYYRLKVIPIRLPPLRERKQDIELLLDHFSREYAIRLDKKISGFTDDALELLKNCTWKGNVRELKNVMEYAVNMARTELISTECLPESFFEVDIPDRLDLNIENHVRNLMISALRRFGDTTTGKELAAEHLGISLATLYRKMKEYDIK